jgi:hypothetical protein
MNIVATPEKPLKIAVKPKEGGRVWWIFGGALVLRLVLVPFNHPWDGQTWYNLLVDLSQNHSPYDTFRQLSLFARSAKINPYYEYFAYPPGLIYLYYPIARLYALFDPNLTYHFSSPGTLPAFPVPLAASLFFKLPVILGDLATGWLLKRMAGLKVAALYLYNPYVIFMSAWMFDSLMVLCLLLGLYWLEKGKLERVAIVLALGTLIKFVPVFIIPAFLVFLLTRNYRAAQILRFSLIYTLAVVLPCLPFYDGLLFVLGFQAQRVGGGLSWQAIWYFLGSWFPGNYWADYIFSFSGAVGALLLIAGTLLTCALVYRFRPAALGMFIAALAGYLAFTKVVNEVYVLPLVPLVLLQLARQSSPGWERCYKLLWSIPLAFALVNVPFFHFELNFLSNLAQADNLAANRLYSLLPRRELSVTLLLTALGFTALCVTILLKSVKGRIETTDEHR